MQVGNIQLGDKEPKCERTALGLVLAHPLTRGEGPREHERLPGVRWGPRGIKHELAELGGSEGRAAFWDSFPQLPTCTQPNRGPDYKSQNSAGPPFPFTPGDWCQTLKETPTAPSPQGWKRSRPAGATLGLWSGPPGREADPEAPASTPDDQKLDNCVTDCQILGPSGTPPPAAPPLDSRARPLQHPQRKTRSLLPCPASQSRSHSPRQR